MGKCKNATLFLTWSPNVNNVNTYDDNVIHDVNTLHYFPLALHSDDCWVLDAVFEQVDAVTHQFRVASSMGECNSNHTNSRLVGKCTDDANSHVSENSKSTVGETISDRHGQLNVLRDWVIVISARPAGECANKWASWPKILCNRIDTLG